MYDTENAPPRRLINKSEIRRLLNTDRGWSLYALADLDDGMFEHCGWSACGDSLALVFSCAGHPAYLRAR